MNYEHLEKTLMFYRDNEKYFKDKKIYDYRDNANPAERNRRIVSD